MAICNRLVPAPLARAAGGTCDSRTPASRHRRPGPVAAVDTVAMVAIAVGVRRCALHNVLCRRAALRVLLLRRLSQPLAFAPTSALSLRNTAFTQERLFLWKEALLWRGVVRAQLRVLFGSRTNAGAAYTFRLQAARVLPRPDVSMNPQEQVFATYVTEKIPANLGPRDFHL